MDKRWSFAGEFLAAREESDSLRALRRLENAEKPARVILEGQELLNLASNDYLGLRRDTRIAGALARGAQRWGAGSGGSRLICGTSPAHVAAEEALAGFHGTKTAITFSSGYAAGVGLIASLAGRGDSVILDRLCHASLYDGARLGGADLSRFRHNDTGHLAELLEKRRSRSGRCLVAIDAVYSMDGDRAPLEAIAGICREHGALLVVDEAHSAGALGPGGRGLAAAAGLSAEDALVMGTLGKAFGLAGAYVACGAVVREYLVNACRSFIYSTAPPPALLEAVKESVGIVSGMDPERTRLASMSELFRARLRSLGFDTLESGTQVVPAVLGSSEDALRFAEKLKENGVFAPAIRPPTVPEGTSRVRFSLSAALDGNDFEQLLEAVETAGESRSRSR